MVGIIVPQEIIQNKIFLLRGKKVMLDKDLAENHAYLYKVAGSAGKSQRIKTENRRNGKQVRLPVQGRFQSHQGIVGTPTAKDQVSHRFSSLNMKRP